MRSLFYEASLFRSPDIGEPDFDQELIDNPVDQEEEDRLEATQGSQSR